MKFLLILATLTSLSIANSATAQLIPSTPKIQTPNLPIVRLIKNGTQLRIYHGRIIQTIKANRLKIRVLDSLTCDGTPVQRQTLSGKRFFSQAVKLDKKTGNLAVGVLLQNCLDQNISAVFILQPEPNWTNYLIHRVSIPGKRLINDRFSTYPLQRIKTIGFIDGNLLIKHADATNSEAILVYTSSNKSVGKYAGCVVTQQNYSNSICPFFD
ncbi:MAG: hypothetical protein AAFW70_27315 [Cyanobacteria bacterium J06635_10]